MSTLTELVKWVRVKDLPPPQAVVVDTKIHDAKGCRNVARLRRRGTLWYFPDDSAYVYYQPTHWRVILPEGDEI